MKNVNKMMSKISNMVNPEEVENLQELLVHELKDLYSAELQLTKALPLMAKAASSKKLSEGFKLHLEETKAQVKRLKEIGKIMKADLTGEHCNAMEGLITEGQAAVMMKAPERIKDIALAGASERVEHYEIAGYTIAISLAKELKQKEVVKLLKETLKEEKKTADKVLKLGEERTRTESKASKTTKSRSSVSSKGKLNLNKASKDEIKTLDGVGENTADSIVRLRNLKGKFKTVDELEQVNGISKKKTREISKKAKV